MKNSYLFNSCINNKTKNLLQFFFSVFKIVTNIILHYIAGLILDPIAIYSALKLILDDKKKPAEFPVGVLTTEDRDIWSKARKHIESIGNAEVLKMIDSSILNLIFDNEEPTKDYKTLVQRYLHSNGVTRYNMILLHIWCYL